jgi:hypothetical protein
MRILPFLREPLEERLVLAEFLRPEFVDACDEFLHGAQGMKFAPHEQGWNRPHIPPLRGLQKKCRATNR